MIRPGVGRGGAEEHAPTNTPASAVGAVHVQFAYMISACIRQPAVDLSHVAGRLRLVPPGPARPLVAPLCRARARKLYYPGPNGGHGLARTATAAAASSWRPGGWVGPRPPVESFTNHVTSKTRS